MSNAISTGMSTTDKRRYRRIETSNIISYVCLDREGNAIGGGIGTSVNMSTEGLLLQIYLPIEAPFVLITYIDSEDQLRQIKGKVVHSKPIDPESFLVGIRFVDTYESQYRIIASFTNAFYGGRKKRYG
jgi:hypothetical protein